MSNRQSRDASKPDDSTLFEFYKDEREHVRHHETQIGQIAFQSLLVLAALIAGACQANKFSENAGCYLKLLSASVCCLAGFTSIVLQSNASRHVERSRMVRQKIPLIKEFLDNTKNKEIKAIGNWHRLFVWFHFLFYFCVAIGAWLVIGELAKPPSP